jgi:eukaryotic-like serine/threonine-protein kinase
MGIDLASGAVIARRYRLEHQLGEGGMGAVWAATHLLTRRKLAMKFIRGPVHLKPELRRRFLREARAASAVNHANVVQIHDVFELDDDTPVMVMDLLEGETLARRLARDRQLSVEETARLLLPVVSAVGTAHTRGIVHRDLKPENVFLERTEDGEQIVKVLDFGIAKLTFGAADPDEGLVTGTGTALGTPCYMAPEQCFGEKDVDHRADTWAIGVMLYELLAGCRPIEGDAVGQIVKSMMTSSITPLEVLAPGIPSDLAALVKSMLARERDKRPDDLREVHEVLARHCTVKVRAFGAPASLAPSVLASAPTVESDRIEIVAAGAAETAPAPRGAERTALSSELTPNTTTGAHSVSTSRPPPSRRRLIGGVALLAAAVAIILLARSLSQVAADSTTSSAAAPITPPATPAPKVEQPAQSPATPVVAPSPVMPEPPVPSATRPTRIGPKPAPAVVRRPAPAPSAAAAKSVGTGLFDDRK